MRRNSLWLALLVIAGCGGPSMLRLDDKVFNLVPAEDRAVLEPSSQAIDQAKQKQEEAQDALKKAEDERDRVSKEHELAELTARTTQARLDWMTARRNFREKDVERAVKEVKAAETAHQLERAKLAAAKGLVPFEGFSARKFEAQQLDSRKAVVNAQIEADKLKATADRAEKRYKELQEKLEKARD